MRGMGAKLVNDVDLEQAIHEGKFYVVVMFYQVDTPPCSHFFPEFDAVSLSLDHVAEFFKIEVSENPSLTEVLCVDHVPTTLVFRNGNEIGRYEGPYRWQALRDRIVCLLKGPTA